MQAHSSVEKAGLIGLVKMRLLMSDENLSLRGKILRDAIAEDKQRGLIPFYVRPLHAENQYDSVPQFSYIVYFDYTDISCSPEKNCTTSGGPKFTTGFQTQTLVISNALA